MALAWRTAYTNNANGTSIAVTLSGFSIGDLVFVSIGTQGAAASCTQPAGWTEMHDNLDPGGSSALGASYYKVLDGSEGSTATFTLGSGPRNYSVTAVAIYDAAGAGPVVVTAITTAALAGTSGSTAISSTAIPAPGATGYMGVLHLCARNTSGTAGSISPVPTGYTTRASAGGNSGPATFAALFTKDNISSAGETPSGGGLSQTYSQENCMYGILVSPAGGGGSTFVPKTIIIS